MIIAIASDHRGVEYKNEIINYLSKKYEIIDCSPANTPTDDYPDYAFKVCNEIVNKNADIGIYGLKNKFVIYANHKEIGIFNFNHTLKTFKSIYDVM